VSSWLVGQPFLVPLACSADPLFSCSIALLLYFGGRVAAAKVGATGRQ